MNVNRRPLEDTISEGVRRFYRILVNEEDVPSDNSENQNFDREDDSLASGYFRSRLTRSAGHVARRDTEMELRLCEIWMRHRRLLERVSFFSFGLVAGYIIGSMPGCFLHPTGDTVLAFASLCIGSINVSHFLEESDFDARIMRCFETIVTAAVAAYGMR